MTIGNSSHSPEEVVNFIMDSFPYLGKKISRMLNVGYDLRNIFNFFTGLNLNQLKKLEKESRNSLNFFSDSLRRGQALTRESSALNKIKNAGAAFGKIGAGLGGGYLAAKALQNFPRSEPQSSPKLLDAIQETPNLQEGYLVGKSQEKVNRPLFPIPTSQRGIPNIPSGQALAQSKQERNLPQSRIPQAPIQPQEKSAHEILDNLGISPRIEALKEKNPPDLVAKVIKRFLTPQQKSALKNETSKPIENLVEEYLQETPPPNLETSPQQPEIPQEVQRKEMPRDFSKNIVMTREGDIGKLIDEKQGISTIKLLGGEKRTRKDDELEHPPKDVITAAQDLLEIAEEDRSAPLAYTAYSPENSKLYLMFHNGDIAEYDDIEENIFEEITDGKFTPRTSGENQFGIWNPSDPKSRGATFYKYIRDNPKYSRANKNITWRYLRKGFDYWDKLRKKPKRKRKD